MQTNEKKIFLTDRSGAELDDKCGMAFWWNRKEGGKGIVPREEQFALAIGRETHEDLATIAEWDDEELKPEAIREAVEEILRPLSLEDREVQDKMEVLYRRLGWLVAWALYMEPVIRKRYDNIGVEKEIILDRDPLWVAVTPDRPLRRKSDGHIEYREFKTTISASTKWMNSWLYAIQLHIGIAALQEEINEKVDFAQIQGLMKGYVDKDNRLRHPYVWGYYNVQTDKWDHEYHHGGDWILMPVWEYPGGIVSWVQFCGEEIALQQFPMSPPVFLDFRQLDDWVNRRLHRERHIRAIEKASVNNQLLKNIHFEKRTRNCRPAFGDACPYLQCCWNAETGKDPLRTGDYITRTPHHDVEIIGVD